MAVTVQTGARIPEPMVNAARKRWPQLSTPQILRYALAIALGMPESEALAATRDPRIGMPRNPTTE